MKSISDVFLDYLHLPERHHHAHQVVDQDFAFADAEALTVAGTEALVVADAEVDSCRFADDPDACDGCLLAPPERSLPNASEPLPGTVDAEALTVADTEVDASEAWGSPSSTCSSG